MHSDEQEKATSFFVDEVAPIPPRIVWSDLSITQQIDLRSRLLNYQQMMPPEAAGQIMSLSQGIAYLDQLINKTAR